MTTPLTPPTFGDKFSVAPTDIGSGYAAGIASAGNSLSNAIGAVMGGINQKTGEIQGGILDQKKGAEDTIDMLHQHGMLTDDEYATAKASSLTGQQKIIGMNTADFNMKMKAQLAQQNAMALQNASDVAAMQRTQAGQTGETGRTGMTTQTELEKQKLIQQNALALNPQIVRAPTPVPASTIMTKPFTLSGQ